MTTHIKALTYGPKISAVKEHKCRQTIRICKREPKPGDVLLLHTWAGTPYRSTWDWQERFTLKDTPHIKLFHGTQLISRRSPYVKWEQLSDDELTQIFLDDHFFGRLPIEGTYNLEKLRQDIAWMNDRLLTSGPEFVVLRW
jgi:hypothetical protein